MNKIQAISLFLFFSCAVQLAFSQDGPKVVVFNQQNDEDQWASSTRLVKLSLLEIASGDISLYYEKVLAEKVSAEVGIGMTMDDYLGSTIFDDQFGQVSNDVQQLIGYSFGAGLRYYPFRASDEFYFAPEFKHRFYHTLYNLNNGGPTPLSFEETKTSTNARISVGYVYWFDDNIFVDFYGGVGLNMNKFKEYEAVFDQTTFEYTYVERITQRPMPWLTLGLKFGFGF
jgi:hypothetical protein